MALTKDTLFSTMIKQYPEHKLDLAFISTILGPECTLEQAFDRVRFPTPRSIRIDSNSDWVHLSGDGETVQAVRTFLEKHRRTPNAPFSDIVKTHPELKPRLELICAHLGENCTMERAQKMSPLIETHHRLYIDGTSSVGLLARERVAGILKDVFKEVGLERIKVPFTVTFERPVDRNTTLEAAIHFAQVQKGLKGKLFYGLNSIGIDRATTIDEAAKRITFGIYHSLHIDGERKYSFNTHLGKKSIALLKAILRVAEQDVETPAAAANSTQIHSDSKPYNADDPDNLITPVRYGEVRQKFQEALLIDKMRKDTNPSRKR